MDKETAKTIIGEARQLPCPHCKAKPDEPCGYEDGTHKQFPDGQARMCAARRYATPTYQRWKADPHSSANQVLLVN